MPDTGAARPLLRWIAMPPDDPGRSTTWLRRWSLLGGAFGVLAFAIPLPEVVAFDLWPPETVPEMRLPWLEVGGVLEWALTVGPLVMGLVLAGVTRVVPTRLAGFVLLATAGAWMLVGLATRPLNWTAAEVLFYPLAAVIAAGHHVRHLQPSSALGRRLAWSGGAGLLVALAIVFVGCAQALGMQMLRTPAIVGTCCIGLVGLTGVSALADAQGRAASFGRMLSRCGLLVWTPWFLFMAYDVAPQRWSPEDLPLLLLMCLRRAGPDIAWVVALGVGLVAMLGARADLRERRLGVERAFA